MAVRLLPKEVMYGAEGVLLILILSLIKERSPLGLPHKQVCATQEQENETTASSTLFTSMAPMGEAAPDLQHFKALGGMMSNYR